MISSTFSFDGRSFNWYFAINGFNRLGTLVWAGFIARMLHWFSSYMIILYRACVAGDSSLSVSTLPTRLLSVVSTFTSSNSGDNCCEIATPTASASRPDKARIFIGSIFICFCPYIVYEFIHNLFTLRLQPRWIFVFYSIHHFHYIHFDRNNTFVKIEFRSFIFSSPIPSLVRSVYW